MKPLKIHFLNTIWSDAIVIEYEGHFAMIDTASMFYYPMIEEYLNNLKVKKLDFIFLTHFHADHYGNISNIIKNYSTDVVYFREYSHHEGITSSGCASCEEYIAKEDAKCEEIVKDIKEYSKLVLIDETLKDINFNGINLELYGTKNCLGEIFEDKNSQYYHQNIFNDNYMSVSIFIKHGNYNIFLNGDMTNYHREEEGLDLQSTKALKTIYEKHQIDHIDIYKCAHHGCFGGDPELMNLLNAKYNIITNTDRWLDNYQTIPNMLKARSDAEIFKTDHYQYVFTIDEQITIEKIEKESLFIILGKD